MPDPKGVLPATMRAMVLDEFGADLALRDVARPVPSAGQVLIRVAASGVNPLDIKIKIGEAAHAQVVTPRPVAHQRRGLRRHLRHDRWCHPRCLVRRGTALHRARREHPRLGSHSLAPLSFRGATYSGVFTLLPLLSGEGRAHHGEILAAAAEIIDAGALTPRLDGTSYDRPPRHRAVESGTARGKVVVDLTRD